MGLEKINEYRKKKGLSVEELSVKSGVPLGTLSKINAGITKNPNLETVKAIAIALECTLDDFDDSPKNQIFNLTKKETSLLNSFNKLNDIGQHEASKRVEELTCIDKYKKVTELPSHLILNAAHGIEGATEEDKKHDNDIMNDDNF